MVSERRARIGARLVPDSSVCFTWFEVVVNDWRFDLVEVSEGVGDLHDDGTSFFLRHQLVLLQVEVQIVPLAELQHRAEPGTIAAHQDTTQLVLYLYSSLCLFLLYSTVLFTLQSIASLYLKVPGYLVSYSGRSPVL